MYLRAASLDDLMRRLVTKLLHDRESLEGERGQLVELRGVLIRLTNPLARLSRTETRGNIFSCLGELLWYLSGSNEVDFIKYYISKYEKEAEDGRVWGGYGPRLLNLRGQNQIQNVLHLLRSSESRDTKRAVIQLFEAEDIGVTEGERIRHKDIPCTCTLQFFVRGGRLELMVYMRSNDVFIGFQHDVFCFTMLQEVMARELRVEIGDYRHCVGSLHLYTEQLSKARAYLSEGWQKPKSMPPMPAGSSLVSFESVLSAEATLRRGAKVSSRALAEMNPYWADLVRLLQIHRLYKDNKRGNIASIKAKMASPIFNTYIQRRQAPEPLAPRAKQSLLPFDHA